MILYFDKVSDDLATSIIVAYIVLLHRYFAQNFDWLHEELDDVEDDYILFDCPGMYNKT